MNVLSFTTSQEWFGLCFELLIDGEPIEVILNSDEGGIPYWLIDNGLPRFSENTASNDVRLVSVCGCGQYGCGHTRCDVVQDGKIVTLNNFIGEKNHQRPNRQFVFDAAQFKEIEQHIVNLAKQAALNNLPTSE